MNLRRELQFAILTLAVFNLTLAFVAIGLFMRMGPAIEQILKENVVSLAAAEETLSVFAKSGGMPLSGEARRHVQTALLSAEINVTEVAERPLLERLKKESTSAFEEAGEARQRFVGDVDALIVINREAMHRANSQAQRLGRAGAWAAVLLGIVAFGTSLLVLARLQRRLVSPVVELHQVLVDARAGQRFRRCNAIVDAPHELWDAAQAINLFLDERLGARRSTEESSRLTPLTESKTRT